jgi:hypothetical protein
LRKEISMFSRRLQQLLTNALTSSAAMGIFLSTVSAFASGTFQKTGSMNVARVGHTATLLSNGQVLVAGGDNSSLGGGYLASAEIYNPSTGSWTLTGSMTTARQSHQAVLLPNGQVLVAGGNNASGTLASAELYNRSTGTWTATGSMITARYDFSLTLLPNGEVLAVQGTGAELYNPATGTWIATSSPTDTVGGPNAALLLNGQVLAIGESLNIPSELYDPSTATWSATGSTGTTMPNPITPRLPNGDVFVTGSFASGSASYSTAALYDPSTGQFTLENGPCSCRGFNGALLQTGKILVAGGFITVHHLPYNLTETINSAEVWDSSTQAWTSTGNLNTSRGAESMTILANGNALVAGGETFDKHTGQLVVIAGAELYNP